jgi:hypothetical protein
MHLPIKFLFQLQTNVYSASLRECELLSWLFNDAVSIETVVSVRGSLNMDWLKLNLARETALFSVTLSTTNIT